MASDELLNRARNEYDSGLFHDGLATARELLATRPHPSVCAIGARCLSELGDPPGALELIEQGRTCTQAPTDVDAMEIESAAGEVLTRAGRTGDAITLLESVAATCRDRGYDEVLVATLEMLASAYGATGRHDDAIARSEEALAIGERAGRQQPRAITALAWAHLASGDIDRAEAEYERALELARQREARGIEGWALLAGAEIAMARGDRARFEQRLDEAQEIAEELSMMPLVERCRAVVRRALQAGRTSESSRRSES